MEGYFRYYRGIWISGKIDIVKESFVMRIDKVLIFEHLPFLGLNQISIIKYILKKK